MAAIRDGLADIAIADGRRTAKRMDRIAFTFPDGAEALIHWYTVRGGRAAGQFDVVIDAMLGGGDLGRIVDELAGPSAPSWVVHAGSLRGGLRGAVVHHVIATDRDVPRVAAQVVASVRERYAPWLALVRADTAGAAARIDQEPWLARRPAAHVVNALRLLAASAVAVPFGTPFVLAAASTAIADLTMDATSVYWTEQGPGANAGAVRKLAK